MSEQSDIQAAEMEIAAALRSGGEAMGAMLAAYEARTEEQRLAFVAALIGRVFVSHAMARARARRKT